MNSNNDGSAAPGRPRSTRIGGPVNNSLFANPRQSEFLYQNPPVTRPAGELTSDGDAGERHTPWDMPLTHREAAVDRAAPKRGADRRRGRSFARSRRRPQAG